MRVYLALGSNLGDREEYLRSGIQGLTRNGIEIIRCAAVYSTEPREVLDQPWFLNTAVEANTVLEPADLLSVCLRVEQENDRTRDRNKGPRTLDIDIIFYGNEIVRESGLSIPHPAFAARRFILVPVAEIASNFVDPISRKTISELLKICPDSAEVRFFSNPGPS